MLTITPEMIYVYKTDDITEVLILTDDICGKQMFSPPTDDDKSDASNTHINNRYRFANTPLLQMRLKIDKLIICESIDILSRISSSYTYK